MAIGKEIRNKIRSVNNTQKITSAMEMVAASKMRKTQDQMYTSRPYAREILRLASHMSRASLESDIAHSYLVPREKVKSVGIVVVSTDRGLCGGLNNNLFKVVADSYLKWQHENIIVKVASIGNKANAFFSRFGGEVIASESGFGDSPDTTKLLGITQTMITLYEEGEIDELYIFSNQFVNTMTQQPFGGKLLPVSADGIDTLLEQKFSSSIAMNHQLNWDYLYDSDPKSLIDIVLDRYISSAIYQSVVENIACEMASRMIAMKAASDNASDLIDELQLVFNKARQAAITQEITEIVGGASAVN